MAFVMQKSIKLILTSNIIFNSKIGGYNYDMTKALNEKGN